MKRADMIVKGRVQGVFFRDSTKQKARQLSLRGWVRNEGSDRVHIIVEGEEKAINEMVRFARQGPPAAEVRDIDLKYEDYTGEFSDFRVRY